MANPVAWTGRLTTIGASTAEIAAIQTAYNDSQTVVQKAIDETIRGIDNAGLGVMLTNWRTGIGPFSAGFPGGGLPFGTEVVLLTNNPADDTYAVSAGTGKKLAIVTAGLYGAALLGADELVGTPGQGGSQLSSAIPTGTPPAPSWQLVEWALVQNFTLLSATRNTSEVITTASVLWPDGATGTFTPTTINATFNTIDAFTITYVWTNAGGGTHTITQTAVTRDASGAVTAQPTPTVA